MAHVWKIAPGQRANNWPMCRELGCIAIGWNEIGDFHDYDSKKSILKALKKKCGWDKGAGVGAARTIWRFSREIQPPDIIVANDGESAVVGIGVIKGGYLFPQHPKNPIPVPGKDEWWHRNARLVDWCITERIDLHKKNFFVASTITRLSAQKCDQVKRAYLKVFPELKDTLDDLFSGDPDSSNIEDPTLAEDLNVIARRKIDPTTKNALVSARIGQGRFRAQVLQLWGNRCAVTRSLTQNAIRASHIKPWRESTDQERLDVIERPKPASSGRLKTSHL